MSEAGTPVDGIHRDCMRALHHVREAFQALSARVAVWDLTGVPNGWHGVRPSLLAYRQEELDAMDHIVTTGLFRDAVRTSNPLEHR